MATDESRCLKENSYGHNSFCSFPLELQMLQEMLDLARINWNVHKFSTFWICISASVFGGDIHQECLVTSVIFWPSIRHWQHELFVVIPFNSSVINYKLLRTSNYNRHGFHWNHKHHKVIFHLCKKHHEDTRYSYSLSVFNFRIQHPNRVNQCRPVFHGSFEPLGSPPEMAWVAHVRALERFGNLVT